MYSVLCRLRSAESWTPICLPKFNDTGFLHAHVSYLPRDSPACLLLISTDKEKFFALQEVQQRIVEVHVHVHVHVHACTCIHVLMRDEKEGRKKQARSNKQKGKATQHTQDMYIHVQLYNIQCTISNVQYPMIMCNDA